MPHEKQTRYKIVITEFTNEERLTSREWKEGVDPEKDSTCGYTPQVPEIKRIEREVFKQNTDELDLTAVIKAVNNIN